jgi:hypothetical protein
MNNHLSTALARERAADFDRSASERRRTRVVTGIATTDAPRLRRLPNLFPASRG